MAPRTCGLLDPDALDAVVRELLKPPEPAGQRPRHGWASKRYYDGAGADLLVRIETRRRAWSGMVGIAIEQGLIPGAATPIARWFPALARDRDPRKRTITVEDLLTMRPGLEIRVADIRAWVTSRNWVDYVLARPMAAAPGASMDYSTGNTHLLSAILTKAGAKSTLRFANDTLARPLGFTLPPWPTDPQGIYFGGNDMLMTPRQLLAFGKLYLNRGQANGRQVVPEAWVRKSCEGRPRELPSWARDLGPGGVPTRCAIAPTATPGGCITSAATTRALPGGTVGSTLFIVPELELVIATTASPNVSEERRDHRRQIVDILTRLVVTPLAR